MKDNKRSEYYEIVEKEAGYKIVLKIIVVILLIIGCFFAVYKFVIVSPSAIFKSGINKSYKYIEYYSKKLNYFKDPIAINGVLTADSSNNSLNNIDKYKFDLDFNIDTNSNKYSSLVKFKYDNEDKAEALYLIEDYTNYLFLPNIYDKTIEIDKLDYKNIKVSKLNDIIRSIKDNAINLITDDNIVKGNEEVTIKDNKYNYDYVELTLDKENVSKLIGSIITNIKDDHRLFNDIKDALDMDDKDLDTYLDDVLKDIITKDFNNIKIKYYTKGYFASVIGFKITIDDKELVSLFDDDKFDCIINYKDYQINIYNNDNKYYINILKDNNKYLYVIFNQIKDEIIDMDYEYYHNKGNIHYEIQNNHGNFKFSIVNDNTYSINYDFDIVKEGTKGINNDNVISIKKLDEDEYLDIYNYFNGSFKDDIIGNFLVDYIEKLLNY